MNLVLIGYRGTGKTTVAQRLALALGWQWVDADVELELQAGKSIRAIFDEQGEPYFRDLESQVLRQLLQRENTIVAAGGGVVLRPSNRDELARADSVIWLTADVDTLLARIQADAATADRRPNLTTAGGRHEIERLLIEREPLYRQCAQHVVDTVDRSPDEIARHILALVPFKPPTRGQ